MRSPTSELVLHFTDFFDSSDNLVTENQRQLSDRQFAVDHVKVGAANRAGADPHEQLVPCLASALAPRAVPKVVSVR
jgi:hypothetical protein